MVTLSLGWLLTRPEPAVTGSAVRAVRRAVGAVRRAVRAVRRAVRAVRRAVRAVRRAVRAVRRAVRAARQAVMRCENIYSSKINIKTVILWKSTFLSTFLSRRTFLGFHSIFGALLKFTFWSQGCLINEKEIILLVLCGFPN